MNRFLKKLICVGCISLFAIGCTENEPQKEIEPITLTWYINFSWFDKSWGLDAVSKYITEQTGVHVEYVMPSGDESQQIQRFLTQGITADIITLDAWDTTYGDFLEQNALAPLDVLAEEFGHSFMEDTNAETVQWYTHFDHLYVYPNASFPPSTKQEYSNQSFLVRKDIYEAIGSPDMTTPEGFLQALEDAKNYMPMVDGLPLIPLGMGEFTSTGNVSLEEYLQNFLAILHEVDGAIYDRYMHPDYIMWLETLNEANRRGLILPDIFLDKRVQIEEKIAEGRYFAMLYQWADCTEQLQEIYASRPEQIYIAIDGPKNANGDDHTLAGSSIQGWTVTGISSTSKNQEAALRLLSFLKSDEGQKLIFLGVEDHGYTMEDGVPQLTPEAEKMLRENRAEYDKVYGGDATHWPMMDNLYGDIHKYHLPEESYIENIMEWSRLYTENFSLYAYQDVILEAEAWEAKLKDDERKSKLFVELILAETKEQFYEIWESYVQQREADHFDSVLEARQKQLDENKPRLVGDNNGGD
ncbi:MAG: extracellular solute-binding protein [Bacillota bacterium]